MDKLFEVEPATIASGKSNEWYSPRLHVEAARTVMGGIDLDPASCTEANATVKASRYYTKDDDGLAQSWYKRVYVNPPYSYEGVARGMENGDRPPSVMMMWISKLVSEYKSGNVTQAILCTKADPKQNWFQMLWDYAICFVSSRLLFNRPGLPPERHQFGNVFAYLGPNEKRFVEYFTDFGAVVTPDGVHRKPEPAPRKTLWDVAG